MSRARIYARNLFANWVGYGASLLVMFFMSPFVVHTLGDVDYGVWSLMMSLTGYLGLVELGTQAGIGRFINFYLGKEDIPKVNGIISTGMAIFVAVGALLLIAGGTLAALMPWIFPKIPAELLPDARIICMLIALNLWMSFLSAPFRQIIQAHERFELTNAVALLVLTVRTTATIFALLHGYRLVTLALIQVAGSILGQVCVQVFARRVFPQLSVRPSLVSLARFRELFGFSIWAFIAGMAYRLLYSADTIVIAILLGPKQITYYAIGGMLLYKAADFIGQGTSVFRPKIMQDCARQDWSAVRAQYRRSTDLAMGLSILLMVGMIGFGHEFIVLWMGRRFEVSYTILVILASSWLFTVAYNVAGSTIYLGLNRVKFSALFRMGQGVSNLGLTLVFVLGLGQGIEGVAWGTFYPRIGFGIFGALIAMRWIGMSLRQFFFSTALRWAILGGVFYALCLAVNLLPLASNWCMFFLKVSLATIVYGPLAWVILLDAGAKDVLQNAIARRLPTYLRKVPVHEELADSREH